MLGRGPGAGVRLAGPGAGVPVPGRGVVRGASVGAGVEAVGAGVAGAAGAGVDAVGAAGAGVLGRAWAAGAVEAGFGRTGPGLGTGGRRVPAGAGLRVAAGA
ncbi:hypothetical protein JOF54_003514 [Microlunatus capsulatus]|uniref:Uncharacterized protein n=1 Tax=Microlunatus capsulatus TaxID=99117 RepID=A0ABS4ZC26_9ACTN|nr:hypothetical protein [Microlunatus capsulatus]